MPDFNVRSDSVNVEQIMEQIRARIREKRGVDYTEQQIRELAAVKLEKFLDPRGVRSDLLSEFRRGDPDPNYAFEDDTLFRSTRGVIEFIRRLLRPLLKLFFNPNPLIHVLHMQSQINDRTASRHQLYYELIHNLVVETTRLGIEKKAEHRTKEPADLRDPWPLRVENRIRSERHVRRRRRGRLIALKLLKQIRPDHSGVEELLELDGGELADLLLGVIDAAFLADPGADLLHDLLDVDGVGTDSEVRHRSSGWNDVWRMGAIARIRASGREALKHHR